MGFRPGDDRIMKVPLDWIGFHYYTRRFVSDAKGASRPGSGGSFGTEIEDTSGGRDRYTQFSAVMPTEGPLTDAGPRDMATRDLRPDHADFARVQSSHHRDH